MTTAPECRFGIGIADLRGVVRDGAVGTQSQAAGVTGRSHQRASARPIRNTSGSNLVNLGNYNMGDKIREPVLEGTTNATRIGSCWASRRRVTT